jgi:hypothetical protein
MTLVFTFTLLIPMIALVIYFLIVTNFLRQYSITLKPKIGSNVLRRFNYLDKLALSLPVLTLIPSLVPILGITMPKYRNLYAKISLIGMGAIVFMLGILFVNALGFLLQELSSHINTFDQSDKDIMIVYKRLRIAYYGFFLNSLGIGSTYWLFGIWDFLFTKTTYLFFYGICCSTLASIILIVTLSSIYRPSTVKPNLIEVLLDTSDAGSNSPSVVHAVRSKPTSLVNVVTVQV